LRGAKITSRKGEEAWEEMEAESMILLDNSRERP